MGDIAAKDTTAPSVGKVEDLSQDRSSTSAASTPEHDQELEQEPEAQEQPQQQKRKGGRKPIYATSEERKQRNRQAQAAFRERRTEYIKQLESTIKLHEDTLQTLQQSHRSAADECLMLRYKNSLLERILLEKGIDVQAELQAKTGSPNLGPVRPPTAATPLAQPIQRYAVNKLHQSRRSLSALPTKNIDHVPGPPSAPMMPQPSPQQHPVPGSHLSSPALSSTKSPNFLPQGGQMSPSFGPTGQQGQPLRPQPPLRPQYNGQQRAPLSAASHSGPSVASSASPVTNGAHPNAAATGSQYYPSPFQNHYDQLDQEYDAQVDMMEDHEPNDPNHVQGQYNGQYNTMMAPQGIPTQQNHMPPPGSTQPMQAQQIPTQHADGTSQTFGNGLNPLFDPYDPMLDADPFGLSASMHFPTQFTFDTGR